MGGHSDIDTRFCELFERMARMEEGMNTRQAEYRTDIARLAEDMAKRDTEAARRETRFLLACVALAGLVIGVFPNLPELIEAWRGREP